MLIQEMNSTSRVNVRCDIHHQKYVCRKHIHHFAELVLVLDGKLTVTVNGKTETAEKNQFILLFPFQKHEYTSEEISYFLIFQISQRMKKTRWKSQSAFPHFQKCWQLAAQAYIVHLKSLKIAV